MTGAPTADRRPIFNRLVRKRFRRAVASFAGSELGLKAKILFAGLIGFLLLISVLNVVNSYVGRDFMTAIAERDWTRFVRMTFAYLAVFGASTVVAGVYRFSEERLGLLWREWMTKQLLAAYLEHPTYYRLGDRVIENGEIDNPDQRIAEDVRAFTTTTLSLILMFLNGTITAIAFSGVMWDISPRLFVFGVAYALAGSYATVRLGLPLIDLNNRQLDREANFRAAMVHLRENSESVALVRQEDRIRDQLLNRLRDVTDNFRRMIYVNFRVHLFTTGYNYLIQIIPALIVAPLYFRGTVEFGVITQSAMAFSQLLGAFSLIITQFQAISSFGAVITRLGSLSEELERAASVSVATAEQCAHAIATEQCPECAAELEVAPEVSAIRVAFADGRLAYEGLTLRSARDGRPLVTNLSIDVGRGTNVQVMGSPAPKVALFRVTAGIWDVGMGRVVRPLGGRIMFLPERPYLPPATLRDLLRAPGRTEPVRDEEIKEVLHALELDSIPGRAGGFDAECEWRSTLALAEQSLLGVARMLIASPDFVFLDRPHSALGEEQLERVLDILSTRSISYLTIGDEHVRADRYQRVLDLAADGTWTYQPAVAVH